MGTGTGGGSPQTLEAGVERPRAHRHAGWRWASWPLWVATAILVVFAVLTFLVVTGVTQPLDVRAVHRLRPLDGWGMPQQKWSPWMSRLSPDRMYLMLGLTSLAMAGWRKSFWPLLYGACVAVVSVAVTVLLKVVVERPDPHDYMPATGGSYPSGHIVAVVVCSAGCLLVVSRRVRWWMWTPLLVAAGLMTSGLLVAAAHWPTDVIGGTLLALAVVGLVSRMPLRRRALVRRW